MGHWWVLGVNYYRLWCSVCCLSWCQLTLKNIQLFQSRDMSWQLMFFFPWSKLSQYADQELLKSLSQDTTPDLSFILDPSAWPAGSEVRIKENRPKGKMVLKTETKHKKNGTTRKQKTASRSPGVEPSWSASSTSNSLTTAPQWHTLFKKLILSYLNNFSLP